MKYLYNSKRPNTAAHIWIDDDTACTMLGTGGIFRGKKAVHDDPGGRRICAMCQVNFNKQNSTNPGEISVKSR